MAKIGPKEAATRALAALRAGGKRSKPKPAARVAGKPKASVASNKRVRVKKPKLGPPSTGFDRKAYQRVYVPLHKQYGPLKMWPAEAVAALNDVRSPRP